MRENIFQVCYEAWKKSDGYTPFWKTLARELGYENGELLRSEFKNERKRRGITKESNVPKCKILLYDIETSPICALVWDIWNYNVNTEAILQDWHILSWAAKWIFNGEVISDVLTEKEAKAHDDKRITQSLWKLLNEADVVIGHNCDNYDNKRVNTRFLVNGLPPVSHYQSIDTLKVAKDHFSITSNKLDYINQFLGLPQKEKVEFELWKRAYFGEGTALELMSKYNQNDVTILEDLFLKLRPYIKNMPNMNLWSDDNVSVCRNCGSERLDWNVKSYYTYTGKYKGWRCLDCGAVGRSRHLELAPEKRKEVVV